MISLTVWVNVSSKIRLPIVIHRLGIVDIAIVFEESWTSVSNLDLYYIIPLIRAHVFEPHMFCSMSVQTRIIVELKFYL